MSESAFLGGSVIKAGIPENGGLDRERINQIILEASKGSCYYECQKQRKARINERVKRMVLKKNNINPFQYSEAAAFLDRWIGSVEGGRSLDRTFVHIDMDAFFVAIETLDKPDLAHVPMAVGCNSMLSASNYAARKYGVVSAMPGYIAKKLCPHLVLVPLPEIPAGQRPDSTDPSSLRLSIHLHVARRSVA